MSDETCAVSPDGKEIFLTLPDRTGVDQQIALSFSQASALAITLPRLLTAAMRQRHDNPSLRHVYVVQDYSVELSSDQHYLLMGLSVDRGFDVMFAFDVKKLSSLMRMLNRGRDVLKRAKSPTPNLLGQSVDAIESGAAFTWRRGI